MTSLLSFRPLTENGGGLTALITQPTPAVLDRHGTEVQGAEGGVSALSVP